MGQKTTMADQKEYSLGVVLLLCACSGRSLVPGTAATVRKHAVERAGHVGRIERLDQQACVAELPAATASHKAPQLAFGRPPSPGRLFLQSAEGVQVAVGAEHILHLGSAQRTDQLVLQVLDTHVETQLFHVEPGQLRVGAQSGALEAAPNHTLFAGVIQTRHYCVRSMRTELRQEAPDGVRAADRHHGNALAGQIATQPCSQRLDRGLVADALDQHHRSGMGSVSSFAPNPLHASILALCLRARPSSPYRPLRRVPAMPGLRIYRRAAALDSSDEARGMLSRVKRRCVRARAFCASTSRFRGGAPVVSEARSCVAATVTWSTARSKAASFALDGRVVPLSFRTN